MAIRSHVCPTTIVANESNLTHCSLSTSLAVADSDDNDSVDCDIVAMMMIAVDSQREAIAVVDVAVDRLQFDSHR